MSSCSIYVLNFCAKFWYVSNFFAKFWNDFIFAPNFGMFRISPPNFGLIWLSHQILVCFEFLCQILVCFEFLDPSKRSTLFNPVDFYFDFLDQNSISFDLSAISNYVFWTFVCLILYWKVSIFLTQTRPMFWLSQPKLGTVRLCLTFVSTVFNLCIDCAPPMFWFCRPKPNTFRLCSVYVSAELELYFDCVRPMFWLSSTYFWLCFTYFAAVFNQCIECVPLIFWLCRLKLGMFRLSRPNKKFSAFFDLLRFILFFSIKTRYPSTSRLIRSRFLKSLFV